MNAAKAFAVEHPVGAYFVLTFIVSWGGVLLITGGAVGTTEVRAQDSALFPLVLLTMVAGPAVTGLALTSVVDGWSGIRSLATRLRKWRVGAGWYAVALLAAPLVAAVARSVISLVGEQAPASTGADTHVGLLLFGLVVGVTAGFCEELGWTGFAVPRLTRRYGVVAAGLVVGVAWSAWHILVVSWGLGDRAGTVPAALFIFLDGVAALPAYRVFMVWIYSRTGSLFLAMLMHLSLTASTLILAPRTTGVLLLAQSFVFAAGIWLVVASAMWWDRPRPSLQAADFERTRSTTPRAFRI